MSWLCLTCTLGGSCATLTARPKAPGKLLLSRTMKVPGIESFNWFITAKQECMSTREGKHDNLLVKRQNRPYG